MGIIKPKEGYIMSFKKLSIVLLVVMMVLGGCSAPANEEASGQQQQQQQHENTTMMPDDTEIEDNTYKYGTPVTFDNIVFTITEGTINPVKGDRTEDNYADENGEYFGLGSDIVKAADYEQIEFSVIIENKSDKAIYFSEVGWEAVLPDGYKLEHITVEGKIGEQIPSNYKAEGKVIVVKEKAIQTDQLKLTYNLMDYNEEWREAIWQLLSGEFDAEEYTSKFNPQPVVFEIKL